MTGFVKNKEEAGEFLKIIVKMMKQKVRIPDSIAQTDHELFKDLYRESLDKLIRDNFEVSDEYFSYKVGENNIAKIKYPFRTRDVIDEISKLT